MKKILAFIFGMFLAVFCMGSNSYNGKEIIDEKNAALGQNVMFATPSGGGDCSSWSSPCTFRQAVAKTSDDVYDVILMGAGSFTSDNGVDGTGTVIDKDYVIIKSLYPRAGATIINTDASPTVNLTVSGEHVNFENVLIVSLNTATSLVITGDYGSTKNCAFVGAGTTAIGVEMNSGADTWVFEDSVFNGYDTTGLKFNNSSATQVNNCAFAQNGTGIHITNGTLATFIIIRYGHFELNTLGIDVDSAVINDIIVDDCHFTHNTNDITDTSGVWGELHIANSEIDHAVEETYPTETGVTVSTGDGAWVWTATPTTIIPSGVITTPFVLTNVNVQSVNADQSFKIQIMYGDTVADQANGIYEFSGAKKVGTSVGAVVAFPADSIVSALLMSDTAGVDNAVITYSIYKY